MALIVMPSLLSKRPWARIRARCEASFFLVLSKSARCCSVRGHTYLTLIHLGSGFTYRIVLKLSRGILYQKTFGRSLSRVSTISLLAQIFHNRLICITLRCAHLVIRHPQVSSCIGYLQHGRKCITPCLV